MTVQINGAMVTALDARVTRRIVANAVRYECAIHPAHVPAILGVMRRTHGWCPANEGRACRCAHCHHRRRARRR